GHRHQPRLRRQDPRGDGVRRGLRVRGPQVQDALGHRDADRWNALERLPLLRAQEARRRGERGERGMSSDFFRTRMGQTFYEATMPSLVRELARLNQNLERLVAIAEKQEAKPAEPVPVATAPEER